MVNPIFRSKKIIGGEFSIVRFRCDDHCISEVSAEEVFKSEWFVFDEMKRRERENEFDFLFV